MWYLLTRSWNEEKEFERKIESFWNNSHPQEEIEMEDSTEPVISILLQKWLPSLLVEEWHWESKVPCTRT